MTLGGLLRSGTPLLFAVAAVSVFSFAHPAHAAVRTWDGGGTTNNWSEAANWSSNIAPGSADIATFNGTSTKDATIDAVINVSGIDINSGYTGTITQSSGISMTVGTGDFDISAGTFVGGDSTIDINDAFTVSGGTYTATSGNMSVAGNFTISSGTFNDGSGTVIMDGTAHVTMNVLTSQNFNNLSISKNNLIQVTVSSGDTLVVAGTLTMADGKLNTGSIDARGAVNQSSTFDGGTATLDFGDDSASQTYTLYGGIAPNLRLNSPADASDSLVFASAATINSLSITTGFSGSIPLVNSSDVAVTVVSWSQLAGDYDASAQSSWFIDSFTLASGATFTAPATVTNNFNSNVVWDVPTSWSLNNLTVSKSNNTNLTVASGDTLVIAGTLNLTDGKLNTGVIDTQGDIYQSVTFDGGTAIVNFGNDSASQTYTLYGGTAPTIKLDSPADANDNVQFSAAATVTKFETTADFSGDVPFSNSADYPLVFTNWTQLNGDADVSAHSHWHVDKFTITGGSFTAPALVTSDFNSYVTWDFLNSQVFNDLTINKTTGTMITVASGDTIYVDGTLRLVDGKLSGGTVVTHGDIIQSATFDGGDAIIDFGSDVTAQTYSIAGGVTPTIRLDDLDDGADAITFSAAGTVSKLDVTSGFLGDIPVVNSGDYVLTFTNWTQAAGDYDASAQSSWLMDQIAISGGSFVAPALVTNNFNSNSVWNVATSQAFNNLTVNKANGTKIGMYSDDSLVVAGTLLLTNGGVDTGTLEAQGNVTVASTYDGGSATLLFSGSAVQSLDLTGATGLYNGDIKINKSGGRVGLASALVMDAANQDLIVEEGTFRSEAYGITVNGTSGTFVLQDGATFVLHGDEAMVFNAGQPTVDAGSTVQFRGDNDGLADTFVITDFSDNYGNLTINSLDGNDNVFELGANLDVNGALTITTGTLDVSTSNYSITVSGNWNNAGAFEARGGLVTMDGASQSLIGSTTFNDFTKSVTSAATLTLRAAQTFLGALTLTGVDTEPLSLRSNVSGTQRDIDAQGSRTLEYLDVKDSNNVNATAMACSTGCVDSGNNTNWTF